MKAAQAQLSGFFYGWSLTRHHPAISQPTLHLLGGFSFMERVCG